MKIKKILHCADLHLGAKNIKLPPEKQKFLLQEHLKNLADIFCDKYDLIMICGDLFHNKTVSRKVINSFFNIIEKFSKPVLYIAGNHDENFEFISFPSNFIILNRKNCVYRTENIDFWLPKESYENFDENKINILLAHGEITNKKDNDYFDLTTFMTKKFDYIALGHEHAFSAEKVINTPVVYSGALFANGFDECGDKGFVVLDVIENTINFYFKSVMQTKYQIVDFNITPYENFEILKKSFIENMEKYNKNDITRVVLNGYYYENEKPNIEKLKELLKEFFYIEIEDRTRVKLNFEKFKNETLSFKAEFVNLVENSSIDEDVKNSILTIGLEALQGDDLSI